MKTGTKWLVTLTLIGLSAGCAGPSGPADTSGLSQKQFVSLMQELHAANPSRRASILKKYEVSEADVRAYVTALSANPMALSEVLDTLQMRLDNGRLIGPKNFTPPPPQ